MKNIIKNVLLVSVIAGLFLNVSLAAPSYYYNSDRNKVHNPIVSAESVPVGATAICRDSTYSFSRHRRGTCSHHGGVKKFLN